MRPDPDVPALDSPPRNVRSEEAKELPATVERNYLYVRYLIFLWIAVVQLASRIEQYKKRHTLFTFSYGHAVLGIKLLEGRSYGQRCGNGFIVVQ